MPAATEVATVHERWKGKSRPLAGVAGGVPEVAGGPGLARVSDMGLSFSMGWGLVVPLALGVRLLEPVRQQARRLVSDLDVQRRGSAGPGQAVQHVVLRLRA